jgi:hypothetical protein
MRKKQFESLCRTLLPELPGFACRGWLLHARPVGHVLRGFCCDDSGFDRELFAVVVFFLPLYVPTEYIHFSVGGDRLRDERGCEIWWNIKSPTLRRELLGSIRRQGLPFLEPVVEPRDVVTAIERLGFHRRPFRCEARAYSLAMADDRTGADAALDELASSLDSAVAWQAEMQQRAEQLRKALKNAPEDAQRLLGEWERFSKEKLGLCDADRLVQKRDRR